MEHRAHCHLCEAGCGLRVDIEDSRVVAVRGDPDDVLSQGHICPKGANIRRLQHDPERVITPLRRTAGRFEDVGWDEALDAIGAALHRIAQAHGRDAVAMYYGNPVGHSYSTILYGLVVRSLLGTRNVYSSNSVDALPRALVSFWMYGSQTLIPVPDIDHADLFVILGANPVVSNGSAMSAPGVKRRLKAILDRGGRVVVVDPRRTETAALGEHLCIRPGTDVLLLLSLLREVLAAGARGIATATDLAALRAASDAFTPDRVAPITGVPAQAIRDLARDFLATPRAVIYGRMGTCVQPFGTLCTWAIDVLNVLGGKLDTPGGSLFATPAAGLPRLAAALGERGTFGTFRSRVGGLPEFGGELPLAALCDEIETPGEGQIRAMLVLAGNPVLAAPGGRRLERALEGLDLVVAVDPYLNETTRLAHWVLPPTWGLEEDFFPLLFETLAVRNVVRYSPAALTPPPGVRPDWQILRQLALQLLRRRGLSGRLAAAALDVALARGPEAMLRLLLRLGPYRLRLDDIPPEGADMGPLKSQLPRLLQTADRRVRLRIDAVLDDVPRALALLEDGAEDEILLIGRRSPRSMNSWLHNVPKLVNGRHPCTLRLHPADAAARGLEDGDMARVRCGDEAIAVAVELSDETRPGVASLPHGWGHDRPGTRRSVAARRPGVSVNDILPEGRIDPVSGTSAIFGVPVEIDAAEALPVA